ncbi:hypothetical protein SteCoe_22301 [Stentor coeruleus]|uniref:Uncharacterized protein n=1 Tax=Stentor coeruleus TaxID=5963 RepID=A0A1R2BMR2_9CILI|nr:hypothetical protein SteCoe_22301 [Stentor coeruleus]
MRPTELNFRSPKEKTPDPGYPVVTFDGRKLSFKPSNMKGNFSQGKRFMQYDVEAKKTGYRVGPGTYNNLAEEVGRSKSKGAPVYKEYHGGKDVSNNGYFYYGNHLVFEPAFVMKSRSTKNNIEIGVDASQLLTRPNTTSSFYKDHHSKRSSKSTRPVSAKSPYMTRVRNM